MKTWNGKLTEEQHEWLRNKAHEERKSQAEIIRQLIEKAMDEED